MRGNRISYGLACLVVVTSTCGCQIGGKGYVRGTNPKVLIQAHPGLSQAKVEAVVGSPARHQFTALREEFTVRCVSYYFSSYNASFYLVFTNDVLGKTALAPQYESARRGWQRTKRARWRTDEPDERMQVVLGAPALTAEEISWTGKERYRPGMDNATPPLIMVTVVLAPVIVAETPLIIAKQRKIRSLTRRFDPERVRLGISVVETERLLGAPLLTETLDDGSELRYYGSANHYGYYYLSVAYRDGEANAVFSDDFVSRRKLLKPGAAGP